MTKLERYALTVLGVMAVFIALTVVRVQAESTPSLGCSGPIPQELLPMPYCDEAPPGTLPVCRPRPATTPIFPFTHVEQLQTGIPDWHALDNETRPCDGDYILLYAALTDGSATWVVWINPKTGKGLGTYFKSYASQTPEFIALLTLEDDRLVIGRVEPFDSSKWRSPCLDLGEKL